MRYKSNREVYAFKSDDGWK